MITRMTFHRPELRPNIDDLLKLPIYKQTIPKLTNIYSRKDKSENLNLNNCTLNQSTPYLSLSYQLNPIARKKRIQHRKFYCHKCNSMLPDITKTNFV